MSDPDQEEMQRKRLARLSAMSGGGGGGQAVSSPGPVVVTSLVVGDKTDKVEAMDLDPPASVTSPVKRNRTTSSANYESSPAQILTSLQTVMSVSLPGSEPVTPAGTISCPQVSIGRP